MLQHTGTCIRSGFCKYQNCIILYVRTLYIIAVPITFGSLRARGKGHHHQVTRSDLGCWHVFGEALSL